MCDELVGQRRGEREFQAARTAHLKTKNGRGWREGRGGRKRRGIANVSVNN